MLQYSGINVPVGSASEVPQGREAELARGLLEKIFDASSSVGASVRSGNLSNQSSIRQGPNLDPSPLDDLPADTAEPESRRSSPTAVPTALLDPSPAEPRAATPPTGGRPRLPPGPSTNPNTTPSDTVSSPSPTPALGPDPNADLAELDAIPAPGAGPGPSLAPGPALGNPSPAPGTPPAWAPAPSSPPPQAAFPAWEPTALGQDAAPAPSSSPGPGASPAASSSGLAPVPEAPSAAGVLLPPGPSPPPPTASRPASSVSANSVPCPAPGAYSANDLPLRPGSGRGPSPLTAGPYPSPSPAPITTTIPLVESPSLDSPSPSPKPAGAEADGDAGAPLPGCVVYNNDDDADGNSSGVNAIDGVTQAAANDSSAAPSLRQPTRQPSPAPIPAQAPAVAPPPLPPQPAPQLSAAGALVTAAGAAAAAAAPPGPHPPPPSRTPSPADGGAPGRSPSGPQPSRQASRAGSARIVAPSGPSSTAAPAVSVGNAGAGTGAGTPTAAAAAAAGAAAGGLAVAGKVADVAAVHLHPHRKSSVASFLMLHQGLGRRARAMLMLSPDSLTWLDVNKYGVDLRTPGHLAEAAVAGSTASAASAAVPEGEGSAGSPRGSGSLRGREALQWEGQDEEEADWRGILSMYRQSLWALMTDPHSSPAAYAVSLLITATILLSTLGFCLETVPSYSEARSPGAHSAFNVIEAVTVQVFLADYVLRLVCCPALLPFLVAPLNVVDLVAVVPWYVELGLEDSGMQGTAVFRVLRLLRVFRVLKLGGRDRKLRVVTSAFSSSWDMLGLMAFLVGLTLVGAASLMFFAERGSYDPALGYYVRPHEKATYSNGQPIASPYESVPAGFWWAIVTLMTVGYGDVVPLSVGGRVIACLTMLCGLLSIALPVAVIGTNFSAAWEAHQRQQQAEREGRQRQQRQQQRRRQQWEAEELQRRQGGRGQKQAEQQQHHQRHEGMVVGSGEGDGEGDGVPPSPSPYLGLLREALGGHCTTAQELKETLVETIDKVSGLRSSLRERGEAAEGLVRLWADTLSPPQLEAARSVVACLGRLGGGGAGAGEEGEQAAGLTRAYSAVSLSAPPQPPTALSAPPPGEKQQQQLPLLQRQRVSWLEAPLLDVAGAQGQGAREGCQGVRGGTAEGSVRRPSVHPSGEIPPPAMPSTLGAAAGAPPPPTTPRAASGLAPSPPVPTQSPSSGSDAAAAAAAVSAAAVAAGLPASSNTGGAPGSGLSASRGPHSALTTTTTPGLPTGVLMLRAISARMRPSMNVRVGPTPPGSGPPSALVAVPSINPGGSSNGPSGEPAGPQASVRSPAATSAAAAGDPLAAQPEGAAAAAVVAPLALEAAGGDAGSPEVRAAWGAEAEEKEEPGVNTSTLVQLRRAFATLRGTPLHDRLIWEVREAVGQADELERHWLLLTDALSGCALLTSDYLPEALEVLRSQFRQLGRLGREAAELQSRVALLQREFRSLETNHLGEEVELGGGPSRHNVVTVVASTPGVGAGDFGTPDALPPPPGTSLLPGSTATAAVASKDMPCWSPGGQDPDTATPPGVMALPGAASAGGADDGDGGDGGVPVVFTPPPPGTPPPPLPFDLAALSLSAMGDGGSSSFRETPVAQPLPRVSVLASRATSRAARMD